MIKKTTKKHKHQQRVDTDKNEIDDPNSDVQTTKLPRRNHTNNSEVDATGHQTKTEKAPQADTHRRPKEKKNKKIEEDPSK